MKFITISDTHGLHRDLQLPKGDVLIHAGDITNHGREEEVIDFLDWFSGLGYTHKIFIGGNHDFYLDEQARDVPYLLPKNVTYLNNSACTIGKIKLWGSPVSPDLVNWAFGKHRSEMAEHWRYMPKFLSRFGESSCRV